MTPLMLAARQGYVKVMGMLLDRGACVDLPEQVIDWGGEQGGVFKVAKALLAKHGSCNLYLLGVPHSPFSENATSVR